jgi:hypothetical protein
MSGLGLTPAPLVAIMVVSDTDWRTVMNRKKTKSASKKNTTEKSKAQILWNGNVKPVYVGAGERWTDIVDISAIDDTYLNAIIEASDRVRPYLAAQLHTLTSYISWVALQRLAETQDTEQYKHLLDLCINGLIHERDSHQAVQTAQEVLPVKAVVKRPKWLKVIK